MADMQTIARLLLGNPARAAVTQQPTVYDVNPSLRSYQPSLRERVGNVIYDAATSLGFGSQANRMRNEGAFGSDFFPVLGEFIGADDTTRAYRAGNYGDAALNLGATALGVVPVVGDVAGKGLKKGVRAFHAAFEPFSEFDFSRLGQTTLPNVSGTDVEDWAMNLARIGAWASDKPVTSQLGAKVTMPVELYGRAKSFNSLDSLEKAVRRAGGPEKFRGNLVSQGFGHIKVADEEFGVNSFIGLGPEFFKILKE